MMNEPQVSFITVCYNGFKDTCELIESLQTHVHSVSYEIIVETITMIAEENDTVKFTYDSDSGDITMEAKYDEESYNFAGNLAVDKNSMVITIDDLGSASEDVSGSITWKKGAQFEEVSGDTFDLGNATEEEWQDLLHEIFAAMLGGF